MSNYYQATLEQTCEVARKTAISKLAERIAELPQEGRPCAFLLGGSGADAASFTVHSDLDLMILTPDCTRGLEVAAQLEDVWNRVSFPLPTLNISLHLLPVAVPDPYWRVALWMGSASAPLRQRLVQQLGEDDCRRSHLLESFFEQLATIFPRDRPSLRTHPGGLRALWLMKHLAHAILPCNNDETESWLANLLDGCRFSREQSASILQCVQRLRVARCGPKFQSGPRGFPMNAEWEKMCQDEEDRWFVQLDQADPLLSNALMELHRVRLHDIDCDPHRIVQLVGATRAEKIRALEDGDLTRITALAWCEREIEILSALLPLAVGHPMIQMGLAFNRATPTSMICGLLESFGGPRSRPLFRRRCLFHAGWKKAPSGERSAFWTKSLAEEASPLLRAALKNALWEAS